MSRIAIGRLGISVTWTVLTLTQYISKYREIILKLEGLDDF